MPSCSPARYRWQNRYLVAIADSHVSCSRVAIEPNAAVLDDRREASTPPFDSTIEYFADGGGVEIGRRGSGSFTRLSEETKSCHMQCPPAQMKFDGRQCKGSEYRRSP